MREQAEKNIEALRNNHYPGRGIVIGMDETGKNLVQIYWIMGRSENSRNRVFEKDDESGKLWTEAADPSNVKNPSLIIYTAMDERNDGLFNLYAVSNGAQTDAIIGKDRHMSTDIGVFRNVMFRYSYEPDIPNFTPRISAVCRLDMREHNPCTPYAEISIIKKSPWGDGVDRYFYSIPNFQLGIGLCITTYDGPGDPLPTFSKDPYPLPINGDLETMMLGYWHTLNPENSISIAVKFIDIATGKSSLGIVNRYPKVV